MRAFHEEQFGPLAPVAVFDDVEGADGPLRAIAHSDYGQQVSLFGGEAEQLSRLATRLRNLVSRVNINCKCQRGWMSRLSSSPSVVSSSSPSEK